MTILSTRESELDTSPTSAPARAPHQGIDVTNALRIVRPTLGDGAGIALYRLLRLVALEDIIGRGAAGTAYVAGKKLGMSLGMTRLDDFLGLCAIAPLSMFDSHVQDINWHTETPTLTQLSD